LTIPRDQLSKLITNFTRSRECLRVDKVISAPSNDPADGQVGFWTFRLINELVIGPEDVESGEVVSITVYELGAGSKGCVSCVGTVDEKRTRYGEGKDINDLQRTPEVEWSDKDPAVDWIEGVAKHVAAKSWDLLFRFESAEADQMQIRVNDWCQLRNGWYLLASWSGWSRNSNSNGLAFMATRVSTAEARLHRWISGMESRGIDL
jgi:hypothetical protein